MTTVKNEVFIGLNENCYLAGGIILWWGEIKMWWQESTGGVFLVGEVSKFSASGGTPLYPLVGKTLYLVSKNAFNIAFDLL